jgi:hypothetical protein
MKLITVPNNGQISIGTKWAGRQIRIEELSETELRFSAGSLNYDFVICDLSFTRLQQEL